MFYFDILFIHSGKLSATRNIIKGLILGQFVQSNFFLILLKVFQVRKQFFFIIVLLIILLQIHDLDDHLLKGSWLHFSQVDLFRLLELDDPRFRLSPPDLQLSLAPDLSLLCLLSWFLC